jgi:hydrogenase maturation protease
MHISRMTGHFPQQRVLVGIQPQKLDWGDAPTDAVAAAIPVACEQVIQQIRSWQS